MPEIRSFIAVQLPQPVKAALEQIESRLKSNFPSGAAKWVAPASIHVTLQFLGSVEAAKIDPVTVAIARAAEGILPFRLDVKGLGAFPNLLRANVVWVGVGGDIDCLCRLQRGIQENLKGLGFVPESRPFTPHLTLARLREEASTQERQALGQLLSATSFEPDCTFTVDAVHLMRSQLTRAGAIYSALSTVHLG